jgi:hypothetical protein
LPNKKLVPTPEFKNLPYLSFPGFCKPALLIYSNDFVVGNKKAFREGKKVNC